MPGEDGEADNYVNGFKGLKMLDYDKYVSFECGCQGDRNVCARRSGTITKTMGRSIKYAISIS